MRQQLGLLEDRLHSNVNIVYAQYMHVDRKSVPRNPVGEISCAPCGEPNKFVTGDEGAVFTINFIASVQMVFDFSNGSKGSKWARQKIATMKSLGDTFPQG